MGVLRKQCNLTNLFPNVFVQGLNLAKNRPTSLIWTDYTCSFRPLTNQFMEKTYVFAVFLGTMPVLHSQSDLRCVPSWKLGNQAFCMRRTKTLIRLS